MKPAGSLRFKLYDQVIQAAVGGQGVALGRIPLIAEHLRDGRLTAPFPKRYDSARGYYAVIAPHATERADVAGFVQWLSDEAKLELEQGDVAAIEAPARLECDAGPKALAGIELACDPLAPNRRHRTRPRPGVSAWIERFAPLVAAGARVLDLACGHGRHARYFAARGAPRRRRRPRRKVRLPRWLATCTSKPAGSISKAIAWPLRG